ncbi:hypothetical protein CR203_12215 [Salipaludibacillus neizhouensis]|uniref:DUF5082 domain-containing protein n=1 Tax=Salipaludibacillus neizhouensis TaxID=885475 RepID=A0A3A9KHU9_9BACI|nr:hypothetical protein [Salipaludibacillus neizhouensis]RKL67265.1 hypothetical protein CR203_12215 [Salipaludibacillus neizhouensis]
MLDLYHINRDLMVMQGFIQSANSRLAEKREELDRLEKALTDLKENKQSFSDQKDVCLDPKFTLQTLNGKNANQLDDLKKGDVQASFVGIANEQISQAESDLSTQVTVIKGEIGSIESNISTFESKRNQLTIQRQEVLNQS